MLEKITARAIVSIKNSAEDSGQNVVRRIKNDFARTPKADYFAAGELPSIPFTREEKMEALVNALDAKGVSKSRKVTLGQFEKQKNPDGTDRFGIGLLRDISTYKEAKYKRFQELSSCKNDKGEYRFNDEDLVCLSRLRGKRYSNVQKLMEVTSLPGEWIERASAKKIDFKKVDNLLNAGKNLGNKFTFDYNALESILTPGGMDLEKLMPRLSQKYSREKDILSKISIKKNDLNPGEYIISYSYKNGNAEELLFDKAGYKLNHSKTDLKFTKEGEKSYVKKEHEARTNSYTIVKYTEKGKKVYIQNETRVIRDKSGKTLRTELISPSQVEGVYDMKSIDAKGNVTVLSSGVKDKNGCVTVKKDLEGLDGTKTHYEYYDDPQGNRITYYKITDKTGKVLLDDTQSFEVVSKNKSISTHRGKSYEILTDKQGMNIKNLQTGNTTQIEFDNMIVWNPFMVKSLLSKMGAEELITLQQKGIKIKYIENTLESCVNAGRNAEVGNNMFILEHETGHIKDVRNFVEKDFRKDRFLGSNKALSKIFSEERKNFKENFSRIQQEYVSYFINQKSHYSGKDGGKNEAIAEANALLNTYPSSPRLAMRSNYLQQYFQRTIAKAAELFDGLQNAQG